MESFITFEFGKKKRKEKLEPESKVFFEMNLLKSRT